MVSALCYSKRTRLGSGGASGDSNYDPSKVPGMSFVPIAKTNAPVSSTNNNLGIGSTVAEDPLGSASSVSPPASGVYFLDFSAHFKQCMRLAREDAAAAASQTAGAATTSANMSPRSRGSTPCSRGSRPRTPRLGTCDTNLTTTCFHAACFPS